MTLDEYKAIRISDVQANLEALVLGLMSDYEKFKASRRSVQFLSKGRQQTTSTEQAEWDSYLAKYAQVDVIEAKAAAAKTKILAAVNEAEADLAAALWQSGGVSSALKV